MKMQNSATNKDHVVQIASIIEESRAEGYQSGWNDAITSMTAAVSQMQQSKSPHKMVNGKGSTENNLGLEPETLIASTYDYIKNHPGLKGAKVIAGLRNSGVEIKDNGQSARTAIYRLHKKKGLIEKKNDGWYAK